MNRTTLIIAIGIIIAACTAIYFYAEWEKARFDASLPDPPPAAENSVAETARREKPPRSTDARQTGTAYDSAPTAHQGPLSLTAEEERRIAAFFEYADSVQMSDDAYYEGLLNILTHGMSTEEAVQYLEARLIYNPAILKRIDDARALQYVLTVRMGADTPDAIAVARPIAERLLAADPGNLAAGFYLAERKLGLGETAAHWAAAAEVYRSLLPYNPDSPELLIRLGEVLWRDKPVEAIRYLKQANRVDSAYGDLRLGLAYQRVGDYDTALFHLRRYTELPSAHPVARVRAGTQISNIERGHPSILPIALEGGSSASDAVHESY